uniref:RING-type domain-containing protein n=1 Tax=Gopherus evgoodei TaxID=1825980 RepID=A0A8C4WEV9_9SAUR
CQSEISCYQSPSAPEYHFSPTGSPLSMSSRAMERLQEDVTCSICLDVLEDPVSIECSHNFCRGCLVAHWREVSAQGYQCPECRALSRCLEQGGVGNSPVCLVSIIGEQRRGKYFLMNYLLRRLQRPVSGDGSPSYDPTH